MGSRLSPWIAGGRVEDLTSNALKGTPSFAGDHLLWSHEPTSMSIWGRASGSNVLLSTGGDWTSGVTALATDGTDMVWFDGSQLLEDRGPEIFGWVGGGTSGRRGLPGERRRRPSRLTRRIASLPP